MRTAVWRHQNSCPLQQLCLNLGSRLVPHRKMAPTKESLCSTPARRTTWIMARSTRGTAWGKDSYQIASSVSSEKTDPPPAFLSMASTCSHSWYSWDEYYILLYLPSYTTCIGKSRGQSRCSLVSGRTWLQNECLDIQVTLYLECNQYMCR